MLVLDSGGLTRLSARTGRSLALIQGFRAADLWPPVVPTVVLAESLQGHAGRDANVNRFLKTCLLDDVVSQALARRAAELRRQSRHGSAVDAFVVALAEPGGTVVTGDKADIEALAAHAHDVFVQLI